MTSIYSPIPELDAAIAHADGKVPHAWVASHEEFPLSNFGDALSPLIIAALTGLDSIHTNFDEDTIRLTTCGTIGQEQHNGHVIMWGTGMDGKRNVLDPEKGFYERPPHTKIDVTAVRGPFSALVLERAGIAAPKIFGDPGWLLPKIFPRQKPPSFELGIIMHISDLHAPSIAAIPRPELTRYSTGWRPDVRLISTYHKPDLAGFLGKLDEILSCKRIVSASFHGMIVAHAYGIPASYLSPAEGGSAVLEIERDYEDIDHRFADFYAGAGCSTVATYRQPESETTDWDAVKQHIDAYGDPVEIDINEFVNALPLRRRVEASDSRWSVSQELLSAIRW